MGASIAAHHLRLRPRDPRHAPSGLRLALFRGATPRGAPKNQGFLALPRAEISRLFRARAEKQSWSIHDRSPAYLRRSVAVPDRRRPALRLPQAHEALRAKDSRARRAA